jgi:hypothetical protein
MASVLAALVLLLAAWVVSRRPKESADAEAHPALDRSAPSRPSPTLIGAIPPGYAGPMILLTLAGVLGYFGASFLPPTYPNPEPSAGNSGLYLSDAQVTAELRIAIADNETDYRLLLASDEPKTVTWALSFWWDARFADPRDPEVHADSASVFAIDNGEVVMNTEEVQVALGVVSVDETLREVARVYGEHGAGTNYFHQAGGWGQGGSKTVVVLPMYGFASGGPTYDREWPELEDTPNARFVVDLQQELGSFVRIDASTPPAADGRLHWEGVGGIPQIRVAYTDLVADATEQSRLFVAGLLISLAAGALIGVVQMAFRN